MDVGLVIGLVLFLAFVTLGVVVTVRVVRAVTRGVERTGAQVRRGVEETTLKARGYQSGPVGEVARVRLELRTSIDSTRRALEAGARDDPALKEALGLLDRLHDHARQLDGELRMLMEGEPDRARVTARLPEARDRMRSLKESADSLRFAAQERARQFDAEGLDSLREQIQIESGALRHWIDAPLMPGPQAADAPAVERKADPKSTGSKITGSKVTGSKASDALSDEQRGAELGRSERGRSERGQSELGRSVQGRPEAEPSESPGEARTDRKPEPERPAGSDERHPRSAS